jgi:hypothetical protein
MPPDTTTAAPATPPRQWGIVELFGHARIAGEFSHYPIGEDIFIRIDVPDVTVPVADGAMRTIPAHTKLFGAKAIYSVAFVDEGMALAAAHSIRHQPISSYTLVDALRGLQPHELSALLLEANRAGAIDG